MSPLIQNAIVIVIAGICAVGLVRGAIRSARRHLGRNGSGEGCGGGCSGGCGSSGPGRKTGARPIRLERLPPS